MGKQVLLTIPDDLYQQAEQVAKSRRQEVEQLLTESIVLPSEVDEADEPGSTIPDEEFERERAAFLAMHPTLLRDYFGYHVAFHQGKLVDLDQDLAVLVRRIRAQYGKKFVLIRQVETEPERIYYFRSPRFAE